MNVTLFIKQLAQQLLPVYETEITAQDNAWWIVETITGLSKIRLLAQGTITLSAPQQNKLAQWVHELVVEHKPLQYLVGTIPFLELTITVKPPILIPRPETEAWVAELITIVRAQQYQPRVILDLCTGSGCIALALAQAFPKSAVYAADINPAALALAEENARANKLTNVQCVVSDLFATVPRQQYDVITANPPYISEQEWEQLAPEVKLWEDRNALVASEHGIGLIQLIIAQAADFLTCHGQLFIEIGHEQSSLVQTVFTQRGFKNVRVLHDIHGKERVVTGIWKAR